jgi:hypothetical protein
VRRNFPLPRHQCTFGGLPISRPWEVVSLCLTMIGRDEYTSRNISKASVRAARIRSGRKPENSFRDIFDEVTRTNFQMTCTMVM